MGDVLAAGRLGAAPADVDRYGHLSLGRVVRLLVLGEAPLQDAAREDADEAAVLDHRHALGVVLLEEAEGLVERDVGVDRVVRLLGETRRSRSALGSSPAATTLATSVLRVSTPVRRTVGVDDVHRADLGRRQHLTRLLRRGGRRTARGDRRSSRRGRGRRHG